jgi:hypothetical protein
MVVVAAAKQQQQQQYHEWIVHQTTPSSIITSSVSLRFASIVSHKKSNCFSEQTDKFLSASASSLTLEPNLRRNNDLEIAFVCDALCFVACK